MYEHITYERILKRMLDGVTQITPGIDTREGSVIYNALAPAAVELRNMYIELDTVLNEAFADTQSRDYLVRRCAERGISPAAASKALVSGVFNTEVPPGSRFAIGSLIYRVTRKLAERVYELECETAGDAGNRMFGRMTPVEYIPGLTSAELTEVLIPGEDDEDAERLRRRYFNSFDTQAFGGNIADYKERVAALQGVGGVKVYPAWDGPLTVLLTIISSTWEKPGAELINSIQTAVDPEQNGGTGLGLAPIGHNVTVRGVNEAEVNIETELTYQDGWTWEALKPYAEAAVDEYFMELAVGWADTDAAAVRISHIETRLLGLAGVLDIRGTTINGEPSNLILGPDDIPVRGALYG